MRTIWFMLAALSALFVGAAAQEFSAREDIEFARGLMNRRMHNLAKEVLDRVLESPAATMGEKASAHLAKANVYKDEFMRGRTLTERLAASEKADAAYQEFIRDFNDHPEILQAKMDYAEFLVGLGRYRIRLYEETLLVGGDRKEALAHREKALEKLTRAKDLFDELQVVIPALGEDKYASILELARYYRAILPYFLGQAQPDESMRLATYLDGINTLEDYIFENEDNLRGYWGYLYKGLCHREFREESQRRDAIACFEGILYAFENTIQNARAGWRSWEDALATSGSRNLIENTFWRYAETLNRFGRYDEAIEKVRKMEEIFDEAGADFDDAGYQALLEKARALFMRGDTNGAISEVAEVSSEAGVGNRFIQFHCDRLLARLLDEVQDKAELDPQVVFKAAKGAYSQDRYHDAIGHFYTVLAIDKGRGLRALECWDYISRCYRSLGFEREAVRAAAHGAFELKSVDEARALDLVRRARGMLTRIAKASGSKKDENRLQRLKTDVETVFGMGSGARYETALQKMQEGRYAQAMEEFREIQPDAPSYELARAYVTFCVIGRAENEHAEALENRRITKKARREADSRLKVGYQEAIAAVDAYQDYARKTRLRGEPQKLANRRQAQGIAVLSKVLALKGLERYGEALATLDYFQSADLENRDIQEKAAVLRAQLYMANGSLKKAEVALDTLETQFPTAAKNIVNLKGILGVAWAEEADKLRKKGRDDEALEALVRSVGYRTEWVKATSDPGLNNLLVLAQDLYSLNRFDEAREYLELIRDRWGKEKRPRRSQATALRLARLYLARCLVWQGKYVEAEPLLRELYEDRKRDRTMLVEYASLLTGTVRVVDGRLIYLPGLGARQEPALEGYKLWGRLARLAADGVTSDDIAHYLQARFHQNLVRWAQGRGDLASTSVDQLKAALGPNLDRKKGAREEGYWERRFDWLEKRLRRRDTAPQTPPPPPEPLLASTVLER
jgi:hypothetical protein